MKQIDDNFSHQVWQSVKQFRNETYYENNNLIKFLRWMDKQAHLKKIRQWADATNNYAAQHYAVETFVKGRDVVVYVTDDAEKGFYRGSAHCRKEDHFDSNIGRAIALNRALADLELHRGEKGIYDPNRADLVPPFEI